MSLEECYSGIVKNRDCWNPTKSQTIELNWEEMKLKNKKALKYDVKVLDVVDLEVRQVDEKIHMIFKENNGDTYIENLQKRAQGLVDWLKVQVNDFNNGFEIIILQ